MDNKEVNIFVSGDFCPINRIEDKILSSSKEDILVDLLSTIKGADMSITNLECPITTFNKPVSKTGPALKGIAKAVSFLADSGFNLVTLANNHIMDYGHVGLKDTLNALRAANIDYVGADLDGFKASNIFYFKKFGIKIAVLNFAENEWSTTKNEAPGANPVNPIRSFYSINEAKKNADAVIVINHGGNELTNLPSPNLKELLHYYIDAGADCVINHHTHFISGYEIYKKKPIFYSLGNFIFDNPNYRNSEWNVGLALQLIWKQDRFDFELITFNQCDEKVRVTLHNHEMKQVTLEKIKSLNKIIVDDKALKEQYEKYIQKKKRMYLSYIEPHSNNYLLALQNRNIFPRFWSKRKRLLLLNLIRCESHREALISILEDETSNS